MPKILFISGLCLIIGLERTIKFFFGPQKLKGSIFFFGGVCIVLIGWPLVGMLVETYGFIYLFGYIFMFKIIILRGIIFKIFNFSLKSGFLPVVVNFLRRIPFIGTLLSLPGIKQVIFTWFSKKEINSS